LKEKDNCYDLGKEVQTKLYLRRWGKEKHLLSTGSVS